MLVFKAESVVLQSRVGKFLLETTHRPCESTGGYILRINMVQSSTGPSTGKVCVPPLHSRDITFHSRETEAKSLTGLGFLSGTSFIMNTAPSHIFEYGKEAAGNSETEIQKSASVYAVPATLVVELFFS